MKVVFLLSPALRYLVLAIALAGQFSQPVVAQSDVSKYPNRPIKIIVPYPPGGGADVFARILADKVQAKWGQAIVVENKAGAGGNIGMEAAFRAPPDGYTLMFTSHHPQLGEPPFQHTYASAVCLTRNGAPFFGKLADNIFAAVFTSGVGVLKGTANGHLLADWAAGAESELLTDARAYGQPNRVPPEPLLGWGVKTRMAWDLNRGRGEL